MKRESDRKCVITRVFTRVPSHLTAVKALGATISGMRRMRRRCRLRETGWAEFGYFLLVISKWLLPELWFSDRWSRGTGLWERDCRKSRIWENKEGKYAKPLAKIQVTAIFLKQDMQRNVLPKFIEIFTCSWKGSAQ